MRLSSRKVGEAQPFSQKKQKAEQGARANAATGGDPVVFPASETQWQSARRGSSLTLGENPRVDESESSWVEDVLSRSQTLRTWFMSKLLAAWPTKERV